MASPESRAPSKESSEPNGGPARPDSEPRTWQKRIAARTQAWLLAISFLLLAGVYSVVDPLFENHDEPSHYPVVKYIADHGRLPVQGADPGLGNGRQEASQPPLYYLLAAAATFWIPTGDPQRVWLGNPHTLLGRPTADPVGNKNMVIHTAAEDFPYHGVALAMHIARGISVLCGVLTVLCAYAIAREVLAERPGLALAAASITAFNPMFLFVTGSVNNDNLAVALCSLGLLLMVRLVVHPERSSDRLALQLGLVCGLAALAKLSGLTLLPMAALAFGYAQWRVHSGQCTVNSGTSKERRKGQGTSQTGTPRLWTLDFGLWTSLLRRLAITYGVAALISGWWFVRNWLLYRDPLGLNAMLDNVGRRPQGWSLLDLLPEFEGFRQSYWAVFGGFSMLVPAPLYAVLDALTLLGAVGLLVWLTWRRRQPGEPDLVPVGFLALYAVDVFVAVIRWTMMTSASAGRLMFPATAAISLLLVLGWSSLGRRRLGQALALALSGAMLVFGLLTPFVFLQPAFARPALLADFDERQVQRQAGLTYREEGGGTIRLLGYDLLTPVARPGEFLSFRLYWKVAQPLRSDDSIFVHVLGPGDFTLAQLDTYPGNGGYAASSLPAGAVLPELYNLRLLSNAPSGLYRVEIGLYLLRDMKRLEAVTPQGRRVPGDTPVVFHVRVEPSAALPPPLPASARAILGNRLQLLGYALPQRLNPGQPGEIQADWQALEPLWVDYSFSYQLLDSGGRVAAQHDSMPLDGGFPTSLWPLRSVVRDRAVVTAPPEAGDYRALVAVYDPATGRRLSGPPGDAFELGSVVVEP